MEIKIKRSIIGYKEDAVNKKIAHIKEELKNDFDKLESEIVKNEVENRELKSKIDSVRAEIESRKHTEVEMSRMLLECYLDNTESLYSVLKKAGKVERERAEKALVIEKEYTDLKGSISKLVDELRVKLEGFKL